MSKKGSVYSFYYMDSKTVYDENGGYKSIGNVWDVQLLDDRGIDYWRDKLEYQLDFHLDNCGYSICRRSFDNKDLTVGFVDYGYEESPMFKSWATYSSIRHVFLSFKNLLLPHIRDRKIDSLLL